MSETSAETFGARLARLRLAARDSAEGPQRGKGGKPGDWSQEGLARRLGFGSFRPHEQSDGKPGKDRSTYMTVWLWENDRRLPDAAMMARLAEVLGVSEHYLRYGTEEPTLEKLRAAIREGRTYEYLRTLAGVP